MSVTVYFVRHGQTYFNLYHRMQGWGDTPLTESGRQDAIRAGQALANIHIDYVFSSDLKRAADTARIIIQQHPGLKDQEPIQDPAFREEFFGFYEAMSDDQAAVSITAPDGMPNFHEVIEKYGVAKMRDMMAEADPYHHAENNQEFWHRVNKGIKRLRSLPDGSIAVVVSHGITISSLGERYSNDPSHIVGPLNGSISKFTLTNNSTKIDFYNQLTIPD